ncbi:MAG: peptidylprolyl isomerase [Burkholderiaceae bacterium]
MKIINGCVVGLTWELKDTLGGVLDVLATPIDFLMGSADLLESIQRSLQGRTAGARIDLHLEPEDGFGDYNEKLVFLEPRTRFAADLNEGETFDAQQLPDFESGNKSVAETYTVTDIYPEHVVLDGNHPLAGIALRLALKVESVRQATPDESIHGTCGNTFFTLPKTEDSVGLPYVDVSVAPDSDTRH